MQFQSINRRCLIAYDVYGLLYCKIKKNYFHKFNKQDIKSSNANPYFWLWIPVVTDRNPFASLYFIAFGKKELSESVGTFDEQPLFTLLDTFSVFFPAGVTVCSHKASCSAPPLLKVGVARLQSHVWWHHESSVFRIIENWNYFIQQN